MPTDRGEQMQEDQQDRSLARDRPERMNGAVAVTTTLRASSARDSLVLEGLASQTWSSGLGLLVIPLYLRTLGAESYGLLGILASIQGVLAVMDAGLSVASARHVTTMSARKRPVREVAGYVYDLELIYGSIGLSIVALMVAGGGVFLGLGGRTHVARGSVPLAILGYAITVGARWPIGMYSGVLHGIQQHRDTQRLNAAFGTARHLGGALMVTAIIPSVNALIFWHMTLATVETWAFSRTVRRRLSCDHPTRPGWRVTLADTWRLSSMLTLNSAAAAILKQIDRLMLSALLGLASVGYYTAISGLTNGFSLITTPISSLAIPYLTRRLSGSSDRQASEVLHRFSRLVAFLICPAAGFLIIFHSDVAALWLGSKATPELSRLLAVLSLAGMLNAMMQIPWSLQLAAGDPTVGVVNNVISTLAVAPVSWLLIRHSGISGAGYTWLTFNGIYFLFVSRFMIRRGVGSHYVQWLVRDNVVPMVAWLITWTAISAALRAASMHSLATVLGVGVAVGVAWAVGLWKLGWLSLAEVGD